MTHPSPRDLALLAGGELSRLRRWWIGRHAATCPDCARRLRAFESDRQRLGAARQDLPPGFDWEGAAAEMTGNIRVGLAAGACVGPAAATPPSRPRWRRAALVAPVAIPLIVLLVVGLVSLRPGRAPAGTPWVEGTVVEATGGGIELRQGDRMLSLRHPSGGDVSFAVNAQGTVRARYIDEETGQVTIHNVYAQ